LGLLFVTIDPQAFLAEGDFSGNQSDMHQIILQDREGLLIIGDERLLNTIAKDSKNLKSSNGSGGEIRLQYGGETYIGYKSPVGVMEGTLYVLLNYTAYANNLRSALFNQSLVIMLAFAAAAFVLILFFNRMSKSLNQLTGLMKRISSGKSSALYERVEVSPDAFQAREVNEIIAAFNLMMDETNRLNRSIVEKQSHMYELELITRETEIAFLRSQVNPHFLYNTLTLICGMASEGMDDGIIQVAGALSQIFRYSIKGGGMVSLREELDIAQSYVLIQSLRFEDRFSVFYSVDSQALDCPMPKMVLQPLVENAVVHGLEKRLEHGSMEIGAKLTPRGDLKIWVKDTGIGMEEQQLKALLKRLRSADAGGPFVRRAGEEGISQGEQGVGLLNVNARLLLEYGSEDYRLDIISAPGQGTCVSVRIPSGEPVAADETDTAST
jgi:two-component system sensor histidine kinase YesM